MNRCAMAALAAALALGAGPAAGQTAQELKARFAQFLGPGKYAKIVWQVEGEPYRKPNFDIHNAPSKIMALDTKDGVVRQLAGPKAGTHYSSPTFTWDGKRVIWTDNVKFQYTVTDFADTTGKKVFLNGFEGDGHCYRTADGKDWALATEAKDKGILYQVNIDAPAERVALFTTPTARVGYAGSSCWASISTDGKYIAGGWPNYGALGWVDVAAKALSKLDEDNGCWPNIARDATGDMLYCPSADADYHRAVRIVDRQQKELARPNLLNAGLLGSKPQTFYEALRWTPDRDYVTLFAFYNSSDGAMDTKGYPNPRLINIKTLKMVAIEDNPEFPQGNADVFFYTDGSTSIAPPAREPSAGPARLFDPLGRDLGGAGATVTPVFPLAPFRR